MKYSIIATRVDLAKVVLAPLVLSCESFIHPFILVLPCVADEAEG
jgi:hypothetical protein